MSIRSGLLVLIACSVAAAQQHPQPPYVAPGEPGSPPADAAVLFSGQDVSQWVKQDGSPTGCTVERKEMVCRTGAGNAYSKEKFRDAQLHLEFLVPDMKEQERAQRRGNSGVYLQGRYEVQILDSIDNPTYPQGVLGAIYGTAAPLVNAGRPVGQWQTYDIVFRGPRCYEDQLVSPGTVTVLLNGVLVQDHVSLRYRPNACAERKVGEPGPLMLQDHSNFKDPPHTEMRFRNIWLRHLD